MDHIIRVCCIGNCSGSICTILFLSSHPSLIWPADIPHPSAISLIHYIWPPSLLGGTGLSEKRASYYDTPNIVTSPSTDLVLFPFFNAFDILHVQYYNPPMAFFCQVNKFCKVVLVFMPLHRISDISPDSFCWFHQYSRSDWCLPMPCPMKLSLSVFDGCSFSKMLFANRHKYE